MKKIYIHMMLLAAMVVAGSTLVSCSKENSITGKFTMTVNATKDGSNSKTLSLDGHTLNATWAVGERVTVHNDTRNADLEGYLEAQVAGASTTFYGTLEGEIAENDALTLKFCSPSYSTQNGTLEYIAANCDYATATVTVTSVGSGKVNTGNADFQNQQAIVKFTLQKMADNNALNVTQLVVNDGTSDNTVTPASATNVLFVAIPATSTVNLSSTIDGVNYFYNKTGVNLTAGQYYEIGVKMCREVNLANITENITLLNGDKVTGTLGNNVMISIADGATVTLGGATINNNTKDGSSDFAGITCLGDATINLYGGSIINCSSNNYPGIQAGPSDKTLTIQGEGSLEVQGGSDAAGIGGGNGINCGSISLLGGAITACGGDWGAGIGSGSESSCGYIVIRECRVIARGGTGGAGIGSGWGGSCHNIEIDGGTITAEGGSRAAGIGSGQNGQCGNVEIEGGIINATGGEGASNIGAGYGGECGTVTLPPPEGALSGLFSVSDYKQVRFSRGNLLSNGTFAANQYTYGDYFAPNYIYSGPTIEWDVLSPAEWNYLYRHSTCGFATVNGIHGLIILPDNYTGSSIANPFRPNWIGTYETCPWDDNIYSGDAWTAMENNGVVFLPAAGSYDNGSIQSQGEKGYYSSSSADLFGFYCNAGLAGSGWTRYVSHDYPSGASSRYSIRPVRTEQTE